MCKNCGARELTPARQMLLEAEGRIRREARLARLQSLPGYHREIHVSEHGVTGNGIMRLNAVPGVRITQRREDDGFVYKIVLDSPDDYEAVMDIIEQERPESAKAEAARIGGARPTIVAKMMASRQKARR